jgi:outer membrane lipoprotein SlyB
MRRYLFPCMLLVLATACAESRSGNVYTRDQARTAMNVSYGRVIQVNQVQIEGTKSVVGPLAGGAAGAAVGSTIGGGTGKTVAVVLGGLAGAAGGAVAEEQLTKKNALEITVQMNNGERTVIVQEADDPFYVGEAVRIIKGPDGSARVRH